MEGILFKNQVHFILHNQVYIIKGIVSLIIKKIKGNFYFDFKFLLNISVYLNTSISVIAQKYLDKYFHLQKKKFMQKQEKFKNALNLAIFINLECPKLLTQQINFQVPL